MLSRRTTAASMRLGALSCCGIIGTPCIIACVPYARTARSTVCDWIGGDGSCEIADPN